MIHLDPASAVPPTEQVRSQLAALIRAGELGEGQRLPPVRQLAGDLGLANGTVAKAYKELESAGLVQTRRGGGTTVLGGLAAAQSLGPEIRRWVRVARNSGISLDEAAALVAAEWGRETEPAR